MTREVRKELSRAARLFKSKKHEEAYKIYDKFYLENPDVFNHWDKIRYCWCIYYLFIRDSTDESELMEYAEMVTDITRQQDLTTEPVCVYTQSVFRVIMFLKSRDDWEYMLYWLDKLNPELLSHNQRDSKFASKKEDYYKYLSTASLKCREYEECLEASQTALKELDSFAFNGDIWHKWRIAKSLNSLSRPQEALKYLEEVRRNFNYWYILKETADCYHKTGDNENAIKYASEAVLTDDPANLKVNLYYLIYQILKDTDNDLALTHAKLYLGLKLESGANIAEDIEDLNLDEDNLDINELESEIKNHWSSL